jgi:predicted Zn finger-like uncharacterized protein
LIDRDAPEAERAAPKGKVKVRCHSCGARYLVPQERVRGRRFRVRCRQCDGVIVARCEHGSFTVMPAADRQPKPAPRRADDDRAYSNPGVRSRASEAALQPADDADVWYVGIAGQPHGPHTEQEIVQLLSEGEITRKSYVWRLGDAHWRRIGDVEFFRESLLDLQLTEIFAPDEQPPESVPELSLLGLGQASTVEKRKLARKLHASESLNHSARPYSPAADAEGDGYESFGGSISSASETDDQATRFRVRPDASAEEQATKLRARAIPPSGESNPRDELGDSVDRIRIEELSEPSEVGRAVVDPARPDALDLLSGLDDSSPDLHGAARHPSEPNAAPDSWKSADAGPQGVVAPSGSHPSEPRQGADLSGPWHRAPDTAAGVHAPGKLDTGAWLHVSESGFHDKRESQGRAWSTDAEASERSLWSNPRALRGTLSLGSTPDDRPESDLGHALAPPTNSELADREPVRPVTLSADRAPAEESSNERAAEEPVSLPSLPSVPSSEESDLALQGSVAGAKLPTEMLQLIPRKIGHRSARETAARPTFAPPLPEEAIPPASPSLLLRRKKGLGGRRRVVTLLFGGACLLIGALVAAFAFIGARNDERDASNREDAVVVSSVSELGGAEAQRPDEAKRKEPGAKPVPSGEQGQRSPAAADAPAQPAVSTAVALPESAAAEINARKETRARRSRAKPSAERKRRRSARRASRAKRTSRRKERQRPERMRRPTAEWAAPKRTSASASRTRQPEPPVVIDGSPAVDDSQSQVPDPDQILALGSMVARQHKGGTGSGKGLPETLSRREIKRVMSRLRPKVAACFEKHQDAGTLKLRVTVQPYGRATARVVGALSGTRTANCVLRKVPRLQFKRFSGDSITFTYPYLLE